MAIWSRPIEVTQNADDIISLGFASNAAYTNPQLATPFAFAGTYVEFTARYTSDPSSTLIFTCNSTSGAIVFGTGTDSTGVTYGTITFTSPHAQSVNYPVGQYWCDTLWVVSGSNSYLQQGPFIVSPSVSR